jgi:hypothetical protein
VTLACAAVGGVMACWRVVATHSDKEQRKTIDAQEWS